MKKLALLAFLVGCGGNEPEVTSKESAFTVTGTVRGSYQCGTDWWHVEQVISINTIPLTARFTPGSFPTGSASSNAVTIFCWTPPVPMAWGGISYYNATNMSIDINNGTQYNCELYAHRANKPWQFSAFIWLPAGSFLIYQGSPTTYQLQAWALQYTGTGTRDGISAACNGHFNLLLQ
jgi:hypothetical protein